VKAARGGSLDGVLAEASQLLSGLSRGAGVVTTATTNARLKQIEFVRLEPGKALVVLVSEDGQVENRLLDVPARPFRFFACRGDKLLNARIRGKTLGDARMDLETGASRRAR